MSGSKRALRLGIVAGLAVVVAACSDWDADAPTLLDPSDGEFAELSSGTSAAEQASLEQLVRAVALAVQEPGVRERIRADLRASRHTVEHKLELTSYVRGQRGGVLFSAMTRTSGLSPEHLSALFETVRPLEFYLPVDEHRARWTGGDLLVAGQLEENDPLVAFGSDGTAVTLDLWGLPPETPVLSIVPVETDFSVEIDTESFENREDAAGRAIGTWHRSGSGGLGSESEEICMEARPGEITTECGGGGGGDGSTVTPPDGLYMTYSYLSDVHEPWTRGDPEIEAHIQGPKDGDKSYGKDLSCAGGHASGYRYFDQNGHSWSGRVLLFTRYEIQNFNGQFALPSENEGFNIWIWEDDDTACTIKTDRDMTTSLGKTAGAVATGVAAIVGTGGTAGWFTAAASFIAAIYESANWLKSNDDYVGVGVLKSTNQDGTIGSYDVFEESSDRGNLTIELRDY